MGRPSALPAPAVRAYKSVMNILSRSIVVAGS